MEETTYREIFDVLKECCGNPENFNVDTKLVETELRAYKFQRIISDRFGLDVSVDEIKSHCTVSALMDALAVGNVAAADTTDIVKYFKNKGVFASLHNNDDCLVSPWISEEKLYTIRTNFNIDRGETILLCRDTSFWSNADQGLVITNEGLYYLPDNNNKSERYYIDWGDVSYVQYQELVLYFYNSAGHNVGSFNIRYFAKNPAEPYSLGNKLAKLFTSMASLVAEKEDPLDNLIEECYRLVECDRVDDAILELQGALNQVNDDSKPLVYLHLASIQYNSFQYQKAIESCTLGLKCCEVSSSGHVLFSTIRSSAAEKLDNFRVARADCFDVMQYAKDEEWNGVLCKALANSKFNEFDGKFSDDFLSLPYNKRKVILPVRQYIDLHQELFTVVSLDKLSNIEFPIGHPIANQLYVGHPLLLTRYLPLDSYQLELVEDRVREFCMLVQSLGATKIDMEAVNAYSSDTTIKTKTNSNISLDYKLAAGSGELNSDTSSLMIDELSKKISLHQTFEPFCMPKLPDNLVWYSNEPSWQRLYSQRINGGLTSHEERIETKKSQMIEGRELTEIKGELKFLFEKMDLQFTAEEEQKFVQQENTILSIKVEFAPISQFDASSVQSCGNVPSGTDGLLAEEQEYFDELKDMISDGCISDRDRRFLEKIKKANGITDKRAKELEEMLNPKLTPGEEEYLAEYKEVILEGSISDRDRRYLEKIKKANGISEQRARELEKLV